MKRKNNVKKNKFYWLEGTTKKDIEGLLNNKGFTWLRSQRNRRILVVSLAALLALVALGSYYKQFKEWFGGDSLIPLFVLIAILLCSTVAKEVRTGTSRKISQLTH